MVDGRVFYNNYDPDLKGYGDLWNFIKEEFFTPKSEVKKDLTGQKSYENTHTNNYEIDPEIKGDLDSIRGIAGGIENIGSSVKYNNSEI